MSLNPEKMAQEALKEEACAEQFKYAYPEIADGSDQPHLRILMGHGRIEVGNAKHDGLPALWFGKDGQGLGFERDRFEKAKPNETLLVITFENIQGLEAIEYAVARVREDMTGVAASPVHGPTSGEPYPHHNLDLATMRAALERNHSAIEPNALHLSWVELDAMRRIAGITKEWAMNGHCNTCELEPVCGYPYKPCDCCNQRKFRPIEPAEQTAKVIQLQPKTAAKEPTHEQ